MLRLQQKSSLYVGPNVLNTNAFCLLSLVGLSVQACGYDVRNNYILTHRHAHMHLRAKKRVDQSDRLTDHWTFVVCV